MLMLSLVLVLVLVLVLSLSLSLSLLLMLMLLLLLRLLLLLLLRLLLLLLLLPFFVGELGTTYLETRWAPLALTHVSAKPIVKSLENNDRRQQTKCLRVRLVNNLVPRHLVCVQQIEQTTNCAARDVHDSHSHCGSG